MYRPLVSSEKLILLVSLYIASIGNLAFWNNLLTRLDYSSITVAKGVFVLNFFLVIVLLLTLVFAIAGQNKWLKSLLSFFLLLTAVISYFTSEFGIIFDKEMIRNIAENIAEQNVNEAIELFSPSLVLHVFLLGIVPAAALFWCRISPENFRKLILNRAILVFSLFAVALTLFISNNKFSTYFIRENEKVLVYVNPVYPLVSIKKYVKRRAKLNEEFHVVGTDAIKDKHTGRTVGIFVIGETARADHFSLNGYHRRTNPVTAGINNLVNFTNVYSCGTSTAYSVPCMFSFLDHEEYSPENARQYSNVLDVLTYAGIKTIWEENNSGCKGVCKRIEEINLLKYPDKNSAFYHDGEYFDEAMLEYIDEVIEKNRDNDVLLVMHTLGSHGPLYYRRVPEEHTRFRPYCRKSTPQDCSTEEIVNAYDNTILYTDYFLGKIIDRLQRPGNQFDSFMMYVSDHGESLGENGIYLHGLPYLLAPEAQIHVPMMMWFSDSYIVDNRLNIGKIRKVAGNYFSHDNLTHTLLRLFHIRTDLYKNSLDILYTREVAENLSPEINNRTKM